MQKERNPSLFLPKLAAILLVLVFLSGITEIIFLATYANQTNKLTSQESKLTNNRKYVSGPDDNAYTSQAGTSSGNTLN